MDALVKKILQMLKDQQLEKRCAAALVLAELKLKEAAVAEALIEALSEDNHLLRLYVLGALAGSKSPKITLALTPLLESSYEEIRRRAADILGQQGSQASSVMLKELTRSSLPRQRTLLQMLVHYHEKKVFEQLLLLLNDRDLGEFTLNALRGEMEKMPAASKEQLKQLALTLLKDKKWQAQIHGLARTLRLVGYDRDAKLANTMLAFAAPKKPLTVRLAALAGLRRPLSIVKATDDIYRQLLDFLGEEEVALVRAALDTIRGLKMPADKEITAKLTQLAESRHHDVRTYALDQLGRCGDAKVAKNLLNHLGSKDLGGREAAARSLAHLEGAASALVKELGACLDDANRLDTLCRLIRRQRDELTAAQRQRIAALALETMDKGHPATENLSQLLVAVDAPAFAAMISERAMALRKAKKFDLALPLLRKLEEHQLLDENGRYAALVCGLSTLPSKKELGRASRTTDPILRQLVALLASDHTIATKMKREKNFTDEDLFYIGFNFVESKDDVEKEFGAEMLGHLVEKSGRSKLGKSAKNKLKLVGWE